MYTQDILIKIIIHTTCHTRISQRILIKILHCIGDPVINPTYLIEIMTTKDEWYTYDDENIPIETTPGKDGECSSNIAEML